MLKHLTQHWENIYTKSLDKFLQEVKDYFEDEELNDDSIRQLHRFFQLEDMRKKGVVDNSYYVQKRTEISDASFYILDKIRNEYLPILPVKAVAGHNSGLYFAVEYKQIEEWKFFPQGDVRHKIGIRVEGDSMEPLYIDGDILVCKNTTTLEGISERQPVVIVTTDNSIFVKNIRKKRSVLELVSMNSEFETFELPLREIAELWLVETKVK